MKIKIYRSLTKEEQLKPMNPLAILIREQECEKITLKITEIKGIPLISSILIDEDWLLLEDYRDITFLQVFEK